MTLKHNDRVFMKKIIILFFLLINGCGSGSDVEVKDTIKFEFPIYNWDYKSIVQNMGSVYDEFQLQNNGLFSFTLFEYDSSVGIYNGREVTRTTAGGDPFILLTDNGWENFETEDKDNYYLDDAGILVRDFSYISMIYDITSKKDLFNLDIESELGIDYSWASGNSFREGAIQYSYQKKFVSNVWVIEPEYCGTGCYDILVRSLGSLSDWIDKYKIVDDLDVSEGILWLGMSIFLGENGSLQIYSYSVFSPEQNLLTEEGSWDIKRINGEEVLELSIPIEIKHDLGISLEANPIFSKVGNYLYRGVKYSSSDSMQDEYRSNYYYFNKIASEDLENAYISSQQGI